MSAIQTRNGYRMRMSIDRCPSHKDSLIVSINGDGGGVRLAGGKCCGRWDEVKSWHLSAKELRDIANELECAASEIDAAEDGAA